MILNAYVVFNIPNISIHEIDYRKERRIEEERTRSNLCIKLFKIILKMATDATKGTAKGMTNEQIINNFQALRKEQVRIGNKVSELELELHEHKIVIDTLKEVDGDRKCFRMVGGLLCERTVKDVLPILISNQEQLATCIKDLTGALNKKSQELNDFTEKHNLKIRGQDDASSQNDDGDKKPRTGNVLVVNPM